MTDVTPRGRIGARGTGLVGRPVDRWLNGKRREERANLLGVNVVRPITPRR